MTLTADANGRLCSRELFVPGKSFAVEKQPNGTIIVAELVVKPAPIVRLIKSGGQTLLSSNRVLTNEDTQRVMEEFP